MCHCVRAHTQTFVFKMERVLSVKFLKFCIESEESKYCTRARLSLSQVLDSLKYKPQNIKQMPPNFKEKNRRKLMKKYYKHGLILHGYGNVTSTTHMFQWKVLTVFENSRFRSKPNTHFSTLLNMQHFHSSYTFYSFLSFLRVLSGYLHFKGIFRKSSLADPS